MQLVPLPAALLDDARALLAANDLPTDDLPSPDVSLIAALETPAPPDSSGIAAIAGIAGIVGLVGLIGLVGLQSCGDVALLRSLAVAPAARSHGIGHALCTHVIELAHSRGFRSIWLLTTSARDYFARHGFSSVDRATVPPSVRSTTQFASLCPSSATLMRRD